MERLTKTSDKGGVAFTFDLYINCKPSEAKKILKLAEKLKNYEDAEEQGRMIIFPCNKGDKIHEFYRECVEERYEMAIKAFEEVQEYRAIGTPEECQVAVEKSNKISKIIDGVTECCGYDFGTDAFTHGEVRYCPMCGRRLVKQDVTHQKVVL